MPSRLLSIVIALPVLVFAQTPPSSVSVSDIDKYADHLDSIAQRDTNRVQLFAKVTAKKTLVRIATQADWPEQTEISYTILLNTQGHLVYYGSSPTSESGDWSMVCEHYFNSDGEVVLFVYSVSGFNSECTSVLRQETKLYFDRNFNLIAKSSKLMDEANTVISGEGCVFNYKFPFQVYPEAQRIPIEVRQAIKGLK